MPAPTVNGAALLQQTGLAATYNPQAGGSVAVYALWGLETTRPETKKDGDYAIMSSFATVSSALIGTPNALDTLTDGIGNVWMVEDFEADPTAGITVLAVRREVLITRHRRVA